MATLWLQRAQREGGGRREAGGREGGAFDLSSYKVKQKKKRVISYLK